MMDPQMTMLPPPGPMPQWADCQGCAAIVVWYRTGDDRHLIANLDGTEHECPGLAFDVEFCAECGRSACVRLTPTGPYFCAVCAGLEP